MDDKIFEITDDGVRVITAMYTDLCDMNALYNRLLTGTSSAGSYVNPNNLKIIQQILSEDSKFKTNFNQDVINVGVQIMGQATGSIQRGSESKYFNQFFTLVANQAFVERTEGFGLSPNGHKMWAQQNYDIFKTITELRRKIFVTKNSLASLHDENLDYFVKMYGQVFDDSEDFLKLSNDNIALLSGVIYRNAKTFDLTKDSPAMQ